MTVDPRNPELVWHRRSRLRSGYVVVACVLALVVIAVLAYLGGVK